MYAKGHFGLTLLILSLLFLPFGIGPNGEIMAIIILSALLSGLPDIDIRIGIPHRKFTHSLLFALIIGIGIGILFGYSDLMMGLIGFFAGFLAVLSHLFGDVMTYQKFKPLWPFDDREVAYGFFPAKSKFANEGFLILGLIVFLGYLYIIYFK